MRPKLCVCASARGPGAPSDCMRPRSDSGGRGFRSLPHSMHAVVCSNLPVNRMLLVHTLSRKHTHTHTHTHTCAYM